LNLLIALELVKQVLNKASILVENTNYPLDPEKMEKAKEMYMEYVSDYQSNLKFGEVAEEEPGTKLIFILSTVSCWQKNICNYTYCDF